MDAAKLLRPNPFAGDDGCTAPELEGALNLENAGERIKAIVVALGTSRVFVPVHAHAHPGREADGSVSPHVNEPDPTAQALAEIAQGLVPAPGGGIAMPIFSSAAALLAWDPSARPLPVLARNAAAQALLSAGLLVLDPAQDAETYLGRSAVAAIGSGDPWIAPWEDEQCQVRLLPSRDLEQVASVDMKASSRGTVQVLVHMKATASKNHAYAAIEWLQRALIEDPYLRSHLDLVEIVPTRLT
ncbi:SseB family protein [Arcanobacterium haemolyticum]|nr:SseB family protein [Arcanobacterium haemolyticum]